MIYITVTVTIHGVDDVESPEADNQINMLQDTLSTLPYEWCVDEVYCDD